MKKIISKKIDITINTHEFYCDMCNKFIGEAKNIQMDGMKH